MFNFWLIRFPFWIYIYIHPLIDYFVVSQLFSVASHPRFSKVELKPGWLIRQAKILPYSNEKTSISEGILNAYVSFFVLFTYIHLTANESSIHSKILALRKWEFFLHPSQESSTKTVCVCVCVCMEIILKKKVIKSEEVNMKESRRYNVSVSKNHHQDGEKILWNDVRSSMDP